VIINDAGDNLVQSGDNKEGKKSKEQLEAEKRAILVQRIKPLEISGFEQQQLADKARELHHQILRLEGEKYDLEKRFKQLQVEVGTVQNVWCVWYAWYFWAIDS